MPVEPDKVTLVVGELLLFTLPLDTTESKEFPVAFTDSEGNRFHKSLLEQEIYEKKKSTSLKLVEEEEEEDYDDDVNDDDDDDDDDVDDDDGEIFT